MQDSKNEAVRLWAAADSRRTEIGYRFAIDRGEQDAALARAKGSVGADEFDSVWAEGAKLSADEAIAYAARGRGERKRPTAGWVSLTPSELEVVRLVGEHLSNPEIAPSRPTWSTSSANWTSTPGQNWPPRRSSAELPDDRSNLCRSSGYLAAHMSRGRT